MTSQLFASPSEVSAPAKRYGNTYNGRYHMPLLEGEQGPKDGSPWVSRGCQRMTNLVGAFEDTRALSIWEQGMGLIGLALAPELFEELVVLVEQAAADGVVFERLRDYPELKERLAGSAHDQGKQEASIIGQAKRIAKAHAAAVRGTVRHAAWEHFSQTGNLIGTPEVRKHVTDTATLLADAGLQVLPDLAERVVRNTEIDAVGRFDNIVLEQSTGRLLMADLKTKVTAFYSWMTVDAQLAGYAYADWMLTQDEEFPSYEPGPREHVDLTEGVIMHTPSDGSPGHLRRADLLNGWEVCKVAKRNIELRNYGKSVERYALSPWVGGGKNVAVAS